jgi:hypothetical protein
MNKSQEIIDLLEAADPELTKTVSEIVSILGLDGWVHSKKNVGGKGGFILHDFLIPDVSQKQSPEQPSKVTIHVFKPASSVVVWKDGRSGGIALGAYYLVPKTQKIFEDADDIKVENFGLTRSEHLTRQVKAAKKAAKYVNPTKKKK